MITRWARTTTGIAGTEIGGGNIKVHKAKWPLAAIL